MKMLKITLSICLTFLAFAQTPQAQAQVLIDRKALVDGTYDLFPFVLQLIGESKEFRQLPNQTRDIFLSVLSKAQQKNIPLVYNPDPKDFYLETSEPARLLRTPIGQDGVIEVNTTLLNQSTTELSIPTLFKFFFHELSHKTQNWPQEQSDAVGQWLENVTRRWTHSTNLEDDSGRITVFSVPYSKVDLRLTEELEVEPSFLVFLETKNRIDDLTPRLLEKFHDRSLFIQSIWAEGNEALLKMVKPFMSALFESALPQFMAYVRQLGLDKANSSLDKMTSEVAKKILDSSLQMRVLEMHNVDSVVLGQTILIRIHATFTVSRPSRNALPIKFNIPGIEESFPVPLTFEIAVKSNSEDPNNVIRQTEVTLRPSLDFSQVAKVASVHRTNDGQVARLTVEYASPDPLSQVKLQVSYGAGYFMMPSSQVSQEEGNSKIRAEFEIPWRYYKNQRPLVAESIMLGSKQSLLLDRLIELDRNGQNLDEEAYAKSTLSIKEDSLGFWGRQGEKPLFLQKFDRKEPVFLISHLNADYKSLNATPLELQFELDHPAAIKEVRVHFTRTTAIIDLNKSDKGKDKEEKLELQSVPWGAESHPLVFGGTMKEKKDWHEIASAGPGEILCGETASGSIKCHASFPLDFNGPRKLLDETEAYIPPMIMPWQVEIVTEDGRTYHHYFTDPQSNSCEEALVKSH